MLKLMRVLRLGRIITYMNSTDDVKLSLRLLKLCFFLLLYIHVTGCAWFYVISMNQKWLPAQFQFYEENRQMLYESNWYDQYPVAVYNAILALTGNDIFPSTISKNSDDNGYIEHILGTILILAGAIINAHIFGTIAVIVGTFSRKAYRF